MTYKELLEQARPNVGPYCTACPVCNGRACGAQVPGPGAKGSGDVAIRNFEAWQKIRVNMNTIAENNTPDTSFSFFGLNMKYPVFAGPVGAVNLHYGDKLNDITYNDILVSAAAQAGIAAFTGDGTNAEVMKAATKAVQKAGGIGIPTVKPWDINTLEEKFALVKASGCFAVAMDVDAAGLPFLQGLTPPAGSKTVTELREIIKESGKPFIIKGIMTVQGALDAKEAGASAIVVSNHGGRVQDQTPSTAEVLEEIADAVGVHESTVSRSINGKFIQTPRGVYEIKYFFSSGVGSGSGEGLSSNSIKTFIKEIIDGEDPKKPCSDQDMVEILSEKGIEISRRTVAKYRESMNILSSSKRRRY